MSRDDGSLVENPKFRALARRHPDRLAAAGTAPDLAAERLRTRLVKIIVCAPCRSASRKTA